MTDSDRVFRGTVESDELGRADPRETVRAIADGTVSSVPIEATLDAVVEVFATEHATWVPVLDADRHVVGTVDTGDLVGRELKDFVSCPWALDRQTGERENCEQEERTGNYG